MSLRLSAALFLGFSLSLGAESLPDHVSYHSLCCLPEVMESNGVAMTFSTEEVQQLPMPDALLAWKKRTFLAIRFNAPERYVPLDLVDPMKWYQQQPDSDFCMVEIQKLRLGKDEFLMSLYATSPVTRSTTVWSSKAEFRFSVDAEVLAVDGPGILRKTYRIFFWNPTGTDLAIVDYDPGRQEFIPVLAISNSNGTFNDGGESRISIPTLRREITFESRVRLFDMPGEDAREKGYLPAGSIAWELATMDDMHLLAYRNNRYYPDEPGSKYQPGSFFKGVDYTTAWVKGDLP